MSLLGTVGSFYMFILILLLVVGFGLTGLWIINFIFNPQILNKTNKLSTIGGNDMNRWLRLSVFSLVGIIISMVLLALITPGGMYGSNNMNMHGTTQTQGNMGMSMGNMQSGNMQGGGMGMMSMPMDNMQSSNMQSGGMGMMNMMPMGNMQGGGMGMMNMMPMSNMQSGSMSSMPMSNMQSSGMNSRSTGNVTVDNAMIIQKLNNMQMQINQMQQMMMNNSNMSGGSGGSMSSGGGGMSMM